MFDCNLNQLSQQALSYDPFNAQLLRTQAFWGSELTTFRDLVAAGLSEILQKVPLHIERDDAVLSRTQAILKGVLERRGLNLGVGNRKDITRRMTARIGVLLESVKDGVAVRHPVILTVRPAWSGLITNVRVFDVRNNYIGSIPLRTPFAPIKETGMPKKLVLTLSCRKIVLRVKASKKDDTCGFDSDEEEQVEVNGRLQYRKREPVFITETVTELKFKFTDESTGQYTCRRLKLNLDDLLVQEKSSTGLPGRAVQEFTSSEYLGAADIESREIAATPGEGNGVPSNSKNVDVKNVAPPAIDRGAELDSLNQSHDAQTTAVSSNGESSSVTLAAATVADKTVVFNNRLTLSVQEDTSAPTVTETNIECAEILREGLQFEGRYFMVRIVNEVDVTQVTLLSIGFNKVFVFMMTREHIDRTHNMKKRLLQLLLILRCNALVEPLFTGLPGLPPEEAARIENPAFCLEKHCFVHLHPYSQGATIILVDPNNRPMLGSGFEVMEAMEQDEDGHENQLEATPDAVPTSSISRRPLPGGSWKATMSQRGRSMRGGPLTRSMSRMRSTKSFRNNAIDEFLNGNMNPPAVIDDESEGEGDEDDDEEENIRSVSYKGRNLHISAVPVPVVSNVDDNTVTLKSNLEEKGETVVVTANQHPGDFEESGNLTAASSGISDSDSEEGDGFVPLPTITTRAVPLPSSVKGKRPPRVPAAGVRAIARRGMTDGLTLEKALAAAAELQATFFSVANTRARSVSWEEWDAEKKDEESVLQNAMTSGATKEDIHSAHNRENKGGEENSAAAHDDADLEDLRMSPSGGKAALEFLEEGNEEEFLRGIVDVPWIEELGSIEVVEYVMQDVVSVLIQKAVAVLTEQYLHLPIFEQFVSEVIQQGSERAEAYLQEHAAHTEETAVTEAEQVVVEELLEDVVDELAEERSNKLNLIAFKAAVAAEAAAAAAAAAAAEAEANKTAKKGKKVKVTGGSTPNQKIKDKSDASPTKAVLTIVVPAELEEEKVDDAPVVRTADVPFSQPYRAVPDSPTSSVPVIYNVQKIVSKLSSNHSSSRPYSKRDTLVPVLGSTSVGKKRHTSDALLSAQMYHAPEYLGQQSPLNSVYTGTFSRSDAFPEELIGSEFSSDLKSKKLPGRNLHVLRLNTISALPVIEVNPGGLNDEILQPTNLVRPSDRAAGLRRAAGSNNGEHMGPIMSVSTVAEADHQPFRKGGTADSTVHHHHHGHTFSFSYQQGYDDDNSSIASMRSDKSGGSRSSPAVFRNTLHRAVPLPVDEESVYSLGSSSRAGARRSPNKRTMLEFDSATGDSYDNDLFSLGEGSSLVDSEMCSVRTGTGRMRRQPRTDPLQVPPRGYEAFEKKRIVEQSLGDYKYIGYVKERPLVHSSHWRGKVFAYLSSLRNADHLRKHVAMLTKATQVVLTPEEAVCALAHTSGSVGEVTEKLKNLEFFSELKLVCRSLHVRSMVCMLEGGERLFKDTPVDTFGDHGEFDDFSLHADELLQKRTGGSVISKSLQHSRSVMAKGLKTRKTAVAVDLLSKTAPLGAVGEAALAKGRELSFSASTKHGQSFKSFTAPTPVGAPAEPYKFDQDIRPMSTGDDQGLLAKLFHFERDEPIVALYPEEEMDDGKSGITSLSMSLGSTQAFYSNSFKSQSFHGVPLVNAGVTSPVGKPYALSRSNTATSVGSASSAASQHTASSAADQAAATQLTPGIRSMLSLPRSNTVMDIMAQSATVQSKATFVPLKFASTGGSKSRLDTSFVVSPKKSSDVEPLLSPNSSDKTFGKGSGQTLEQIRSNDAEEEAEGGESIKIKSALRSSISPSKLLATSSSAVLRTLESGKWKAEEEEESGPFRPPMRRGSMGPTTMMRRSSMGSFRLAGRIDDLLVEHGDTPLAVMCRRDFLKAQQDEVLLKSDKNYIRRPIEKKIGMLRSSFDGGYNPPPIEEQN